MAGGRPSKYKPEYCQQLIEHMAKGNSFWSFAADCDCSFETLSNWTHEHPEFLEAKKTGMAKLLKFDENLALMGSSGQLKRVARVDKIIEKGPDGNDIIRESVHHEQATFAQTYHIFKMKNRYPKFYRDKIVVENQEDSRVVGKAKKVVEVMKDEKMGKLLEELAEKLSEE